MTLFILYTYQAQSHGPAGTQPPPTEECHAFLFLTQSDAEAAVDKVKAELTNDFTVAGSFGFMVLPLEQVN
jgi:hypothetical protein